VLEIERERQRQIREGMEQNNEREDRNRGRYRKMTERKEDI
jgi:hypothetical protein